MRFISNRFFGTIKFRLAMIFTLVLFVVSGSIMLLFNIAIDNYLSTREPAAGRVAPPPPPSDVNNDLRAIYSDNLESIKTKSVLGLPFLALACFALGYYLAGRFLRPLKDLNFQIAKLKSSNLGEQIENITGDEIGETIRSFNEMSLRLKSSFEQQSRFVQDASHELRTPLTIVKTNLETVLDDKNATKGELRESMGGALRELESVTELANDLLTLSSPQSSARGLENLSEIVEECFYSFKDYASKRGVSFSMEASVEPLNIVVNRTETARAISNFMDNAVKYSEGVENPTVTIKVLGKSGRGVVEIRDNGVGIPEEDLKGIFERFYRVDQSRVRKTGGFGLGLPIAKKIILEHGGEVFVTSRPGDTVFSIDFPIQNTS